jgi:hypothetical protein
LFVWASIHSLCGIGLHSPHDHADAYDHDYADAHDDDYADAHDHDHHTNAHDHDHTHANNNHHYTDVYNHHAKTHNHDHTHAHHDHANAHHDHTDAPACVRRWILWNALFVLEYCMQSIHGTDDTKAFIRIHIDKK